MLAIAQLAGAEMRYIMYLTGQHNIVPEPALISRITHVALAFMRSSSFNVNDDLKDWPLFTSVEKVRTQFANGTKIMVAIGGWGDVSGFEIAARTEEGRQRFAGNIKRMIDFTNADGVDIDWEYPGGNGEDYKRIPNSSRVWEITAYPLLLAAIREAIGPDKLISAAVPGAEHDMMAFTKDTVPAIAASLDFFNIMTYDLMNRRDNVTKHHSSARDTVRALNAYIDAGVPPEKANFGYGFYMKLFRTDPDISCDGREIGCPTVLMEDPDTGADLGQCGGFSWHDTTPAEFAESFGRALVQGRYDSVAGAHYYWDGINDTNIWWTFDVPYSVTRKFEMVMQTFWHWMDKEIGGVFAWGLGEDGTAWENLQALTTSVRVWEAEERVRLGRGVEHQVVM